MFKFQPSPLCRVDGLDDFVHGLRYHPAFVNIGKPGVSWVGVVSARPSGQVLGVAELLNVYDLVFLAEVEAVAGNVVEFQELVNGEWVTRVVVGKL